MYLIILVEPTQTLVFLGPSLLGTATCLWGCSAYAFAKNRHVARGCAGFLCILAIPLLIRLKVHHSDMIARSWTSAALDNRE